MAKKKTKAGLNLELTAGKEISSSEGSLLTNISCRNCADKNETLVQKILEVRPGKLQIIDREEVHWSQERRDSVGKKACTRQKIVVVLAKKLAATKERCS